MGPGVRLDVSALQDLCKGSLKAVLDFLTGRLAKDSWCGGVMHHDVHDAPARQAQAVYLQHSRKSK